MVHFGTSGRSGFVTNQLRSLTCASSRLPHCGLLSSYNGLEGVKQSKTEKKSVGGSAKNSAAVIRDWRITGALSQRLDFLVNKYTITVTNLEKRSNRFRNRES